jgi:hypothetical protein
VTIDRGRTQTDRHERCGICRSIVRPIECEESLMTSIRLAFRTDLLLVIALAFGAFGCAGISTGHSGGGDDGGGNGAA